MQQEDIIFSRDANNKMLKDLNGTYDFYKTLLRYNREEKKIIRDKMKELESRFDHEKWHGQ